MKRYHCNLYISFHLTCGSIKVFEISDERSTECGRYIQATSRFQWYFEYNCHRFRYVYPLLRLKITIRNCKVISLSAIHRIIFTYWKLCEDLIDAFIQSRQSIFQIIIGRLIASECLCYTYHASERFNSTFICLGISTSTHSTSARIIKWMQVKSWRLRWS